MADRSYEPSTDDEVSAVVTPADLESEDGDPAFTTSEAFRASSARGRGRPGPRFSRRGKGRPTGGRGSFAFSQQIEAVIHETNANTIILKNEVAALRTDLANLSQRLTIVYSTGGQGPLVKHNRTAADQPY